MARPAKNPAIDRRAPKPMPPITFTSLVDACAERGMRVRLDEGAVESGRDAERIRGTDGLEHAERVELGRQTGADQCGARILPETPDGKGRTRAGAGTRDARPICSR